MKLLEKLTVFWRERCHEFCFMVLTLTAEEQIACLNRQSFDQKP